LPIQAISIAFRIRIIAISTTLMRRENAPDAAPFRQAGGRKAAACLESAAECRHIVGIRTLSIT
jgi:hypothetical protein